MDVSHIIEPERHGLWIAAGFIVALLALVIGFTSIYRVKVSFLATQTEVLMLNKKIEQLKSEQAKLQAGTQQPAAAAPAASAATAAPSK